MSFLVCNHLEEEKAGCFTLIVFLMSCDCWYSVVLLSNAVGGFVALRPKSTAIVIAGRSVNLTTLFPGQA